MLRRTWVIILLTVVGGVSALMLVPDSVGATPTLVGDTVQAQFDLRPFKKKLRSALVVDPDEGYGEFTTRAGKRGKFYVDVDESAIHVTARLKKSVTVRNGDVWITGLNFAGGSPIRDIHVLNNTFPGLAITYASNSVHLSFDRSRWKKGTYGVDIALSPAPEPGTLSLLGGVLGVWAVYGWRRRQQRMSARASYTPLSVPTGHR